MCFPVPSDIKARCTTHGCLRSVLLVFVFGAAELFVHACPPGQYGELCNLTCNCQDPGEHCAPDGQCRSGCRAGYHGKGCAEKCSEQWYGVDCAKKCLCGQHCPCNPVTGVCSDTDCAHLPGGRTGDYYDGKTWITFSLLGVCILFVVLGLFCVCYRRKDKDGLIKKIKQTSLDQYRKKQAEQKSSNLPDNVDNGNLRQKDHIYFAPLHSTEENAPASCASPSNNDDCRAPVPSQLNSRDKQDRGTDKERPPSDLNLGGNNTRSRRNSKVKVLYVPKAAGVTGAVDETVYENPFEVTASKFKTPGSASSVAEGRTLSNMLQMDPVYSKDLPAIHQVKTSSMNLQSPVDKRRVLPPINMVFPPEISVAAADARLTHARTSSNQKPLGQLMKLSPETQGCGGEQRCLRPPGTTQNAHPQRPSDQPHVVTTEKEVKGDPTETVCNTIMSGQKEQFVRTKLPVSQYDVTADATPRLYVKTGSPTKHYTETECNSGDIAPKPHSNLAEPVTKSFDIKTVEHNFDTTDSQESNFTEKSQYTASFSRNRTESTVTSFSARTESSTVSSLSNRTESTVSPFSERTESTVSPFSERTESTVSPFSERTESAVSHSSDQTVSPLSVLGELAGSPVKPFNDQPASPAAHITDNRRSPKSSTDDTAGLVLIDEIRATVPEGGSPVSSLRTFSDKMATYTQRHNRFPGKTESPDHRLISERETSCPVPTINSGQSTNTTLPLLQPATVETDLPSQAVSGKGFFLLQCVDNQLQMPQRPLADETKSSILSSANGAINQTHQLTTEAHSGEKPTGIKQLLFQSLAVKHESETTAYNGETRSSLTSAANPGQSSQHPPFVTSTSPTRSDTGSSELNPTGKAGPSEQQEAEIYEFNDFTFISTDFPSTSTVLTNNSQRPATKQSQAPEILSPEKWPSSQSGAHGGKSLLQFSSANSKSAEVPVYPRTESPTNTKHSQGPSPIYVNEPSDLQIKKQSHEEPSLQTQKQLQTLCYSASSPNFTTEQKKSPGTKLEFPDLENLSPAESQKARSPLPGKTSQIPGDAPATTPSKSYKTFPLRKASRTSHKVQAEVRPHLQAACVKDFVVQTFSASGKTNQKPSKPKRSIHFPNVFKTRTAAKEKAASSSVQKTKPMASASKDHLDAGPCADTSRRVKRSDPSGGRSPECLAQKSGSPSPQHVHRALGGQRRTSCSPGRHGRSGLTGGNCEAFENTQYYLMGAQGCNVQPH